MFSKKLLLGFGVAMLLVFSAAMPAFASIPAEEVKVEGIVQSIDFVTGTFTVMTEPGIEVTIAAPEGFDLNSLVLGDKVEAQGTAGLDDVISATKIETQTAEFEVEDEPEVNDVNDDNGGQGEVEGETEVEDETDGKDDSQDEVEDQSQGEVENDDDHSGNNQQDSSSQSGSGGGDESHDGGDD